MITVNMSTQALVQARVKEEKCRSYAPAMAPANFVIPSGASTLAASSMKRPGLELNWPVMNDVNRLTTSRTLYEASKPSTMPLHAVEACAVLAGQGRAAEAWRGYHSVESDVASQQLAVHPRDDADERHLEVSGIQV